MTLFNTGEYIYFNKAFYYISDVVDNGNGKKEYNAFDIFYEPPRPSLLSAETVDKEAVGVTRKTALREATGGKRKRTRRRTSRNKKSKRRVQKRKSFKKRKHL